MISAFCAATSRSLTRRRRKRSLRTAAYRPASSRSTCRAAHSDPTPSRDLPDGISSFSFPAPVYGAERSREFLRWRYETHPGFRYEFLLSDNLKSVLVFHEERESGTGVLVIRVVDFLAAADDQDALLGRLLRIAQERKAAIVDFFCSLDCYDAFSETGRLLQRG